METWNRILRGALHYDRYHSPVLLSTPLIHYLLIKIPSLSMTGPKMPFSLGFLPGITRNDQLSVSHKRKLSRPPAINELFVSFNRYNFYICIYFSEWKSPTIQLNTTGIVQKNFKKAILLLFRKTYLKLWGRIFEKTLCTGWSTNF